MIHYERTLDLHGTPDAVWAVLGRFMYIDEFAPLIKSVEALTDGEDGVGSTRRCIFDDGTSVVEEVTKWDPEKSCYHVKVTELASPLKEMHAELSVRPLENGRARVHWALNYRLKFGPFGWLLGQTIIKMVLGKIIDGNLEGLAAKVQLDQKSV